MGLGWFLIGHAVASSSSSDSENKTPYKMVKVKHTYSKEDYAVVKIFSIIGVLVIITSAITFIPMVFNSLGNDIIIGDFYKLLFYLAPVGYCVMIGINLKFKYDNIGEETITYRKEYDYEVKHE